MATIKGTHAPGSTIVVTGASAGIGEATALLALRSGHRVAALSRTPPVRPTEDWSAAVETGLLRFIQCDVRHEEDVVSAFHTVSDVFTDVTGVVCNAGIDTGAPSHELSLEKWNEVIATNLTGAFLTCREAIRLFRRAGRAGSIVCMTSPWSFVAPRAGAAAAYASSKGGVSSLVRALAVEYAGTGIRVNAVTPGATETKLMWANVEPGAIDATRAQIKREVPMGRLAEPIEPAHAALWLISDAAGYITGANLNCDGGVLAAGVLTV